MAYKLKIGPAQGLKLKGQAGFALPMVGGVGIRATKSGGIWTVDLDYTVLTPGPVSDAATAYVAIEDKTAGIYREVSLASLLTSGLDADLQAIAALTSTGVLVRTAADTWAVRTITGTANEITVTNGDGVSGNPTVSLPTALTFTGKTVTGGTYTGVVSINGNIWTAGTGTLTLGPSKTAAISNTLTFTGTDGATAAFGAGGTVAYQGGTLAQFAATTSAQLRGVLSDETGTGAAYFQGGDLGTPSAGVATNLTGTAAGLTAGHVTTNANLTGDVTSVGNASTIAANAVTNAKLATAADGTIKSNISGGVAAPSDNTITAVLDKLFGTTQGGVIYRGASTWGALTPGTSGNFLKTQGAAANPMWDSIPGGGDMLSTNNLSDVANASTALSNLGAGILSGFRNKIINGNFDIWQRATSQTASGYGSDDRWTNEHSGSTKTASQQTFTLGQTDVPGNPRYYSRTVVTSVAGASNCVLKYQKIEGVQTLAGKTVTVTFYAKADAAKNMAVELYQDFGTGGSPSSNVTGIGAQLVALTTTWQKFSVAIAISSISGKTLGTGLNDNLRVCFWFDAGSSFNTRAASLGQQSGTFDIARVSIVDGTATAEADPFAPLQIGQVMALCQRYYYRKTAASASDIFALAQASGAGNIFGGIINLPVTMRATPTLSLSSANHISAYNSSGGSAAAFSSGGPNYASQNSLGFNMGGGSGLTTGNATMLFFNTASGWVDASAEL